MNVNWAAADGPCPDGALRHGPADASGRCSWCGNKIARAMPQQRVPREVEDLALIDAYRRTHDPDWGTDRYDDDPYRHHPWESLS